MMVNAAILNAYEKLNDTAPLETDLIRRTSCNQQLPEVTTNHLNSKIIQHQYQQRVCPGHRDPLKTRVRASGFHNELRNPPNAMLGQRRKSNRFRPYDVS